MYTTINMLGMIRGHVDRMELLKKQDALVTETPDEKVNPAILVKNIVGTANVPIRATINAPEAYGGIRLLGIPGCGTVVCHADQIENVYKAVDTATGVRVRRVLRDVLGDDAADKYDVSAFPNAFHVMEPFPAFSFRFKIHIRTCDKCIIIGLSGK